MRVRLEPLNRLVEAIFPTPTRLLKNFRLLAVGYGQKRSIDLMQSVDSSGRPIPWYTYPAIEYLSQFDVRQAAVFEFGAGNSSLFWAQRARKVVSVESDESWFDRVVARGPKNLDVKLRQDRASYVGCLLECSGQFDIIAIDGRWRNACIAVAPRKLLDGGIIVLDNADRYSDATATLRNAGFFQVDFNGFGPINDYTWTTSVFVQAASHLQRAFSGPSPVGGLTEVADPED